MAIDPYEPELAKRHKAFEIAETQLKRAMPGFSDSYYSKSKELRHQFTRPLAKMIMC